MGVDFDWAVCINLDSRADRWERFNACRPRLPRRVDRYAAVDGKLASPPAWFCAPPGAWGCLRTHLRIWEDALSRGDQSVLVFEDDALFAANFTERCDAFLAAVPDDWDQIYLGGQHLYSARKARPPEAINDQVLRCHNVNRTHAYAIRREMMAEAYGACALLPAGPLPASSYHVDHRLGAMHETGRWSVYAPHQWLVGQAAGYTDVLKRPFTESWWNRFSITRQTVTC